jgi:hypothetical protein
MYEFQNVQNRRMAAQAIPSYAPRQATAFFNKMECFCFSQYTLEPGEKREWPVAFVIDPRISKDVKTITLSYTFFEVGGKTPQRPKAARLQSSRQEAAHDAGRQEDRILAQHCGRRLGHAGRAQGQGVREGFRQHHAAACDCRGAGSDFCLGISVDMDRQPGRLALAETGVANAVQVIVERRSKQRSTESGAE